MSDYPHRDYEISGYKRLWKETFHKIFQCRKKLPLKMKKKYLSSDRCIDILLLNAAHLCEMENLRRLNSAEDAYESSSTEFELEELDGDYAAYIKLAEDRWTNFFNDIVKFGIGPYYFGHIKFPIDNLNKLITCGFQLVMEKRNETIDVMKLEMESREEIKEFLRTPLPLFDPSQTPEPVQTYSNESESRTLGPSYLETFSAPRAGASDQQQTHLAPRPGPSNSQITYCTSWPGQSDPQQYYSSARPGPFAPQQTSSTPWPGSTDPQQTFSAPWPITSSSQHGNPEFPPLSTNPFQQASFNPFKE